MTLWIKAVQRQAFSREIQQLSRKDTKLSLPLIRQLRLYLDDNAVLRCRGRLESAPLDDQSKFPVLLPKNEHFTSLVALAAHVQVLHGGARETLTQLREKYWIPRGRKCVTCRKTDGPPYRPVSPPSLPPSRVSEGQAFSITGVDYAGPFVRQELHGRQKSHEGLYCIIHMRSSSSRPFRSCGGSIVGVLYSSGEFQKDLSQITRKTSRTVARESLPCLVRFWRQRKPKDTWQVME